MINADVFEIEWFGENFLFLLEICFRRICAKIANDNNAQTFQQRYFYKSHEL